MGYGLRIAQFMILALPVAVLGGCGGGPQEASPAQGPSADTRQIAAKEAAPLAAHPGEAAAAAPREAPNQVVIDNFTFNPPRLVIPAGAKVTWVNRDDVPHTATSTSKPRLFNSGTLDTDDRFEHVFKAPGTYEYFCAVHPHMTGQIIVK